MDLLGLIELAIVLSLVYLALSFLASGMVEAYTSVRRSRAAWLRKAVNNMLSGCTDKRCEGLAGEIMAHPLIEQQGVNTQRLRLRWVRDAGPTYVDAELFALAFADVLKRRAETNDLRTAVGMLDDNEPVAQALPTLLQTSGSEAESLQRMAKWFEASMEVATEWFKKTRISMLFVTGVFMAWATGMDTIRVANVLYNEPLCGQQISDAAAEQLKTSTNVSEITLARISLEAGAEACDGIFGGLIAFLIAEPSTTQRTSVLPECACARDGASLWLPGMKCGCSDTSAVASEPMSPFSLDLVSAIGYLITGLAVSMGAPFWFDGLKNLLRIRMDIQPKTQAAESKDKILNPLTGGTPPESAPVMREPALTRFEATLSQDDIKDLQAVLGLKLNELTGRIDGRTRIAVIDWQEMNELEADGHVSQALYAQMMAV